MAMTYSQIKTGLDQVAADIVAESNRVTSGTNSLVMAANNLAGFPAKYGTLVTEVDALIAASPSDPAALVAKAEMDRLVAEFITLTTRASALVTAVQAVG